MNLVTSGAVKNEIHRAVIKQEKEGSKSRNDSEGGADATRECCVGTAHQRIWQVIL